ncbi:pectinesterase inhibitor 9-like [Curcuma longa]|uniref:pectinesterase inhibitor 9-like n=1 Tax=Curcuma longa TaxID=136217 RepID=UPI003D9E94E7
MAQRFRPFILFLAVSLALAVDTTPAPGLGQPVSPRENATEFIRCRCGATRYPGLCYTSLAGYSGAVQQNPAQLARLSANVTLSRLASLMARVAGHRRACYPRNASATTAACPEAAALGDCAETLGDASDLTRKTEGELRGLVEGRAAGSADAAWRVSNAQTWMSAVLSDEETCADGFEEVATGSRAKTDVTRRLWHVKKYTSNALGLVNSLAGTL